MTDRSDQVLLPYIAGVIIVLAAAYAARVIGLDAQSLWYDEGNSVQMIERSAAEIVRAAGADIHPPGYYLLLALWGQLAGSSVFALRFLSLAFGMVIVSTVIRLVSDFFSKQAALLAGLFIALHPLQVYYSQEARMYAQLTFFSAAAIFLSLKLIAVFEEVEKGEYEKKNLFFWGGAYCLIHAGGLYTHYSFPFVMVAEVLAFLVYLFTRKDRLKPLVGYVLLGLGVMILYLPQLGTAIRQILYWPRDVLASLPLLDLLSTLIYSFSFDLKGQLGWLIPPILLAIIGTLPSPRIAKKGSPPFFIRILLIALVALLVPVALVVAKAMTEANLKFLLIPNLAFWILVARGVIVGFEMTEPALQPDGRRPVFTTLIVASLFLGTFWPLSQSFSAMVTDSTYARDDYRGLVAHILAESGPEAAVVLSAPNQWEVFSYYLSDDPNILPLRTMADAGATEALDALLSDHKRIYGVYWGELQHDPDRSIERALEARAFTLKTDWFGSVRLVTYVRPTPPAAEMASVVNARIGDALTLVGYTLSADQTGAGDPLGVTLFWETDDKIEARYKVFVHIYGQDGEIIAQHDGEPASDLRPFTGWEIGELVIDAHGLLLPDDLAPGTYPIVIGVYNPAAGNVVRLPVSLDGEGVGDSLIIAEIVVG